MTTEVVITIAVVLAAEWGFVRETGALQVPIPPGTPAANPEDEPSTSDDHEA